MTEPTNIDLVKMIKSILRVPEKEAKILQDRFYKTYPAVKKHCNCRSGSPDVCPICTDMKTGEKYNESI